MFDSLLVPVGNFFFRYRNAAFPVILLGLYAAAVPPDFVLGSEVLELAKDAVALALVLAGLGLRAAVIGFAYIKRGGLNKRIYADKLVTEGVFATCRNPLYTGNMLVVVGLFVLHGHPLVFAVGVGLFWFIYTAIIAAEERYLRGQFGAGYDAYCREVPRWLPALSTWREATAGMSFSFKRVLVKDYTTIALSLSVLCLGELYEYVGNHALAGAWAIYPTYLATLVAVIVALGLATLTISRLKKAKVLRAG